MLRANPICEVCRERVATEVDHIVPLHLGGDPWAWSNLQAICSWRDGVQRPSCHELKSKREREARMRASPEAVAVGRDGWPVDPDAVAAQRAAVAELERARERQHLKTRAAQRQRSRDEGV